MINKRVHKIQNEDSKQQEIKLAQGKVLEAPQKLFHKPKQVKFNEELHVIAESTQDKSKCVIL